MNSGRLLTEASLLVLQPIVNANFFLSDLKTTTGRLASSTDVAVTLANQIATLEATISKNQTYLASMSFSDKLLWSTFKMAMGLQYNTDKCAQVYLKARDVWQTCCAYDSLGGTSFSFCAATALLGLATPDHKPAKGIDYEYDPATVVALPVSIRDAKRKTQEISIGNDLGSRVLRELAKSSVPVYTVNLFPDAPAGRCTSAQLQYACFSMCCDSIYATVRILTTCRHKQLEITSPQRLLANDVYLYDIVCVLSLGKHDVLLAPVRALALVMLLKFYNIYYESNRFYMYEVLQHKQLG
jgi:hypothetical protein